MHLLRRSFGERIRDSPFPAKDCRMWRPASAEIAHIDDPSIHSDSVRNRKSSNQGEGRGATTRWRTGRFKRTTILSIDGGRVRGVIASTILETLEKAIQDIDGPSVALADCFDVIAGTSTGGLLTAMLTTPDANGRPKFSAKLATQTYIEQASVIFPYYGVLRHWWQMARGPKHDEKGLVATVERLVGNCRLQDTVTKVVIPAFDISLQQPVFFSSARAKLDPFDDPMLSQVCLGTTAAPVLLPAVHFTTSNLVTKEERYYHLVDGGVVCNNPTAVAIMQVVKEVKAKGVPWVGSKDLLVLSLGTGEKPTSYDAREVANWGLAGWVRTRSCGSIPLLDMFSNGSGDMVDYNRPTPGGIIAESRSRLR